MLLTIPEPSLVLLVGASGSGKSTFARRHFKASEIVSSDFCRHLVADDEADQSATRDAFLVLRLLVRTRLKRMRLTVVDATNVQAEARRRLLRLAFRAASPAVAIVFHFNEDLCLMRNDCRPNRRVSEQVIREQREELARSLPELAAEGFSKTYVLENPAETDSVEIQRSVIQHGNSVLLS